MRKFFLKIISSMVFLYPIFKMITVINQNTTSHDEKIFFEDHFFNGFLIPNFQDDHGHKSKYNKS